MVVEQTLEIVPRDYCLCFRDGNRKFYFSPSKHVIGNALRLHPNVLRNRIRRGQAYKRRQWELYQQGRSYEPKLPWPEEYLTIDNIDDILRECVKRREGYYTIFDAEPYEAVRDITLRGELLTAKVKSKTSPSETTSKYYEAKIKSAFLDQHGDFDLIEMNCQCPDHGWGRGKGGDYQTIIECVHLTAMEQEFYERLYANNPQKTPMRVRGRRVNRQPFSPFNFVANWTRTRNRFQPRNPHMAALEEDVKFTYYVLGKGHFDINNILLSGEILAAIISPSMLEGLRRGTITFEVLKQKRREREISRTEHRAYEALMEQMDRFLRRYGYRQDGCFLELGRPAVRYENRENIIGVVFSEDLPPFYTIRKKVSGTKKLFERDEGETNPFSQIGRNQKRLDDKTKIVTPFRVEIPHYFRLPELTRGVYIGLPRYATRFLQSRWRRAIGENHRNPEFAMRYAHLNM